MTSSRLSIVLVDDEEAVRVALTDILLLAGYKVFPAPDAEEAIRTLRTHKVDLVITDLMMPGMTGVELIDQAGPVYPHLPFIVLSAYGTTETALESLQHGAVDFLSKPISRGELIIAVERNIERRRIEAQRLQETTAQFLVSAIQAFAAAIDVRDPYTAGHSQRVARIADRIAPALGVSEEDRYILRLAGAMHDIGKIGVPDAILRKPGRLSATEWEEMRRHPRNGSEIISHIQELGEVATLIRHHHESVDGSGYPDGLESDAIPLLARVLAVADAYEALTSDRSYRKAMSREGAVSVLRDEAGRRYDPQIVETLADLEGAAR